MEKWKFATSMSSFVSDSNSFHNSHEITNNAQNVLVPNPISFLNDLRLNEKYFFAAVNGSPHDPTFEAHVDVVGQSFYGIGSSKKEAKYEAAKNAVDYLLDFTIKSKVNIYQFSYFINMVFGYLFLTNSCFCLLYLQCNCLIIHSRVGWSIKCL